MLESIVRHDRAVVATALALVTAAAWTYLLWLAAAMDMGGSGMGAMPGAEAAGTMLAPALAPWSPGYVLFMAIMWSVMMVGMMIPSAAPMILIYARVGRQAQEQGKPFASTAWFASGYLAAWTGFALLATAAQWALERAALLTPEMASASPVFGGLVLIAAGLYQWTPLKDKCLSQCQAPLLFIQRHGGFRREPGAALTFGLHHGTYCIGCCWALMALLFVGGVMNVLWIAAISIFVLAEKIIPAGKAVARAAGVGCVAVGLAMLFRFIGLS